MEGNPKTYEGPVTSASEIFPGIVSCTGSSIDWKFALRLVPRPANVAQVSNLLYRRLPVGRLRAKRASPEVRGGCGLEIRDTADWKSALRLALPLAPPSVR